MRRVHSSAYQQRSLLVLLPLILLAISTWTLNKQITPLLNENLREVLLLSARIFFPGLFAIFVSFMVPTFDRLLQISVVTISYVLIILILPKHNTDLLMNPVICVFASVSSLFALLPLSQYNDLYTNKFRLFFSTFISFLLPFITLCATIVLLKQMNIFIQFTFDETFGKNFFSVVYVPIYLLLQALGFHELVGDLITLQYQNNMVTAFVNAIVVTNLFTLPAAIFTRSLFSKKYSRLFLTLLVFVSILTNSIGACVSLTLLLLLIFYPGTFATLLISSVLNFSISVFLQIPVITSVDNLYLPDVVLTMTRFLLFTKPVLMLEVFAIFIPVLLVLLAMLIKKEQNLIKKRKIRSINVGYSLSVASSPELSLIAMLRAFGGISNISDVEEDGTWLYVQVVDLNIVSNTVLNTLVQDKVLVDRVNKLYLCDIGENSHFLYQRLAKITANKFSEEEYEISLSTPFNIYDFQQCKSLNKI